jgi:hypothetical protein
MLVVVGSGQRLFEDVDTSSVDLRLTDVRKLERGSVMLTYVPMQGNPEMLLPRERSTRRRPLCASRRG